jgi:beta-galactosidase/beta-glucuronidase
MNTISRRTFVKGAAAGCGLMVSPLSCSPGNGNTELESLSGPQGENLPLAGLWRFRTDPEGEGERLGWHREQQPAGDWRRVDVPHTWQVVEGLEEYAGKAWYRCSFDAPDVCDNSWVRLEFEAVYHSAVVWLNGVRLGEHLRKGYTAFTLDLTGALKPGQPNLLAVEVDNAFNDRMLPRNASFDWNMDGGLIRPVNLLVTPRVFIESLRVDAVPHLKKGGATLEVGLQLRNCLAEKKTVEIVFTVKDQGTGKTVIAGHSAMKKEIEANSVMEISLPEVVMENPELWHFDNPHLYRTCVELNSGGQVVHRAETTFGVRKFEVGNGGFHLNGEAVRLMGVERMAGSNPLYGMAEPGSWIEHDHQDMKELNCIYTRVHWQQDRRVLDYCDRHGIMIQLEVPTWGPGTFSDMEGDTDPEIMQNGLEQLREMIGRDRNHPSVVAWGLCNEIGGQHPPAYRFARRMLQEAKSLDPNRLCTYASNSLQQTPEKDVSALMDFIEWNEYYESWYKGSVEEMEENLQAIHRAFPGKPIVISEYGYCQCMPERTEGDRRAAEILRSHTRAYRKYPFVGGAIFFSYNDYRTHIGDKGLGAYKQRVHGVADLSGKRKPSFDALRKESSPVSELKIDFNGGKLAVNLAVRNSLPAYSLKGYRLRCVAHGYDNLPMESHEIELSELVPGDKYATDLPVVEKNPSQIVVDILRPTGFSVSTKIWKA